MKAVVSFAVAVVIAFLCLPWIAIWSWQNLHSMPTLPPHPWLVGAGLVIGSGWIWWKKPNWFIHTFIHEAAHAIFCFILRVPVRGFQATDGEGGAVLHDKTDPIRTVLICIAPYTLPLLLLPILIPMLFLSVGTTADQVFRVLAGFFLILHLQGLYHNIRLNFSGKQADLVKVGRPLSIVLIACALLAVLSWWHWTVWSLWRITA